MKILKNGGVFYPSTTKLNNDFKWRETADTDEQQSNFINWMENDKNNPLENAVAYLQGDKSEFGNLINMYEDYLGYELSHKSIANIRKALNHWWFYAESQFEMD